MKTESGNETEFNELLIGDMDDELMLDPTLDKKARSLAVRRMIEDRLEQKRLKEQIDTWGFDDYDEIDLEH